MRKKLPSLVALLLLAVLQLPFLGADPDSKVDIYTRGAWTDEGLYSSQARNFLNGYGFDIRENTTAVRGPLQVIIQIPFLQTFGHHRWVLRSLTLLLVLISLWLIGSATNPMLTPFLVLIGFLQFHVFQFSHYAMAEMMAVSFILMAAASLARMAGREFVGWPFRMTIATLFLMAAVALKVQYAYVMALLPIVVWVWSFMLKGNKGLPLWKIRAGAIAFPAMGTVLLILVWIMPQQDVFRWVMGNETVGRFGETPALLYEIAHYNLRNSLLIPELIPLLLLTLISMIIWVTIVRRQDPRLIMISLFALAWLLLELHKLPMRYLPNRYLVSLFVSAALFSSSVLAMLWSKAGFRRRLVIPVVCLIAIPNLWFNYRAYERRTYELTHANQYLKATLPAQSTVLGPWAASLTWGTDARTFPVWDTYAPPEDLIQKYDANLVIGEFNQSDSDSAYARRNINLVERADSIWEFSLWRMELKGYWIREQR